MSTGDGLKGLARLFLKLGSVAFGGPAAHIAMLEDEVVARRGWLSRQHFLDLVGATNLIPGPNSTEMAMHIGYERGGRVGLAVAGACFILPAAAITAALAWLYVRYGAVPVAAPVLAGIEAAVIAVIASAVWRLGRTAVKGWREMLVGLGVALAAAAGVNEVVALFAGAAVGTLWLRRGGPPVGGAAAVAVPWNLDAGGAATVVGVGAVSASAVSLWKLGLFFLKVGAVLYGSGYVLVAFLEGGLVGGYGWLSEKQLLDAVAIGQLTPGPVLTTATFVGYVLGGATGALVATVAIFLPSFVFVWLLNPIVPRLRERPWTAAFLDGVNVSAVGLIAAVALNLAEATLTTWTGWAIAGPACLLALRFRLNAAWLVLGGALAGAFLPLAVR